jgi:hypothetical protein
MRWLQLQRYILSQYLYVSQACGLDRGDLGGKEGSTSTTLQMWNSTPFTRLIGITFPLYSAQMRLTSPFATYNKGESIIEVQVTQTTTARIMNIPLIDMMGILYTWLHAGLNHNWLWAKIPLHTSLSLFPLLSHIVSDFFFVSHYYPNTTQIINQGLDGPQLLWGHLYA